MRDRSPYSREIKISYFDVLIISLVFSWTEGPINVGVMNLMMVLGEVYAKEYAKQTGVIGAGLNLALSKPKDIYVLVQNKSLFYQSQ
jgi:hypothetical protein